MYKKGIYDLLDKIDDDRLLRIIFAFVRHLCG